MIITWLYIVCHSNAITEARRIAQTLYRYDKVALDRVDKLANVGEECIRRFKEEGYLIVENFLSQQEIEDALKEISDIIHERLQGPRIEFAKLPTESQTPEERELSVRKVHDYIEYARSLRKIAFHEGIHKVLELFFGEKPRLLDGMALLKPPHGGEEKPWHQDMAYATLNYRKQIAGIWIALDEAGLDNGCMHVIPGSHTKGGMPHHLVRHWQICDSQVDVASDVAVPLKPGGILFFSGLLLHGTPPNFSAKRRRSLQMRFAPESAALMSNGEYKLMFTNKMTGAEC